MRVSLSTGKRSSIFLETSRIPINSRLVHAGKSFPGAMGIFRSLKRSKIWHRAVMHFDWGGGGGGGSKKEIVKYMNNLGNVKFSSTDPFKSR